MTFANSSIWYFFYVYDSLHWHRPASSTWVSKKECGGQIWVIPLVSTKPDPTHASAVAILLET